MPVTIPKPEATAADVRKALSEIATEALELRATPADKRADTWADDVRERVDAINFLDAIEKAKSIDERATKEAEIEERATKTREALERAGLRGPAAAFSETGEVDRARMSAGAQVVTDAGYEDFAQRGGTGMLEVRALLTSGDNDDVGSEAGLFRPVGTPFLKAGTERRRRLFVRDLMSTGNTGLSSVPYIRELNAVSLETGATTVSEGSAKPEVSMQFDPADAPARKIAAWIPATTEILSDAPTLRSYIDARLEYMVLLREEQQALKGTGTAPELEGVTVVTGHQTQSAVAGDVPATFAAAFGKIENVDGDPDGVAMNPLDFWGAIATRHSTQFDNGFSGGAPAEVIPGSLSWGERVVRTRALDQTEAVAASWAMGATLLDREAFTIKVGDQHSDYFVNNKVAILGEKRVALPIWRPDFFVVCAIDLTA